MTTSALSMQTGASEGTQVASHSSDPDRDIVALVARGAIDAALRLAMDRHGQGVYGYCREQLRDAALAEDALQQTFISAHRGLARFAGRSTLRTWLFGIARHRVLDVARPRLRIRKCVDMTVAAEIADPRPAADEALAELRLRRALREALAELDERTRSAVLLRYQQGFTFEEMAQICREKPGTLSARVARAMPRLRARIDRKLAGR
jgi:RNA polymerase sigma-70 factor (ECF subfamily)